MSLDTLLEAAKFLESSSKGTSRDDSAIARVPNSATVQAERRRAFSESEPIERRRRPGGAGTRETHNKLEKNRRAHLKECFDVLKKEVPTLEDKKTSNLNILRSALKYIQSLKKRERDYEHERDLLTVSNSSFRQRLLLLRREIIVKQENAKNALKEPEVNLVSSLAAPAVKVRSVETQVSPVSVATQTTFTSADDVTNWSGGDPVNIESVQVEAVGVAPAGNVDRRSDEKTVERVCVDDEKTAEVCVDDEDEEVDVEGVAAEDCNVRVDEAAVNGGAVHEQQLKNQEGGFSGEQKESNAEDDTTVESVSSNKSSALKRRAACSDERKKMEAKKANIQGCARVSS